ncbi:MAG TPA: zinc ribbon domain-containing protein [Bryobacteraceae bacterium]|nr:zinc ribbon domain-containing protein [Bryobacteraceae bacterium]
MSVRNDRTGFPEELSIVSPWAWVIAVLFFLAFVIGLSLIAVLAPDHPPAALLVPIGILAGALMACYVLLIGYVNRDAGRRGMSRTLWTLIAILVPNALGIVLYFVLRKPRVMQCPQCGAAVEPGFGFCPACRCRLNPVCPQCQRGVPAIGRFCPYCGADLSAGEKLATS